MNSTAAIPSRPASPAAGRRLLRPGWALLALLALALGGSAPGCQSCKPKTVEDQSGLLSFHTFTINPTGSNLINRVEYNPGRFCYFDTPPVLTSLNISEVESFDVPGGKGLRLHLDRHGHLLWARILADTQGSSLALLVDGHFRALIMLARTAPAPIIELSGPFTADEARKITDHAAETYKLLND